MRVVDLPGVTAVHPLADGGLLYARRSHAFRSPGPPDPGPYDDTGMGARPDYLFGSAFLIARIEPWVFPGDPDGVHTSSRTGLTRGYARVDYGMTPTPAYRRLWSRGNGPAVAHRPVNGYPVPWVAWGPLALRSNDAARRPRLPGCSSHVDEAGWELTNHGARWYRTPSGPLCVAGLLDRRRIPGLCLASIAFDPEVGGKRESRKRICFSPWELHATGAVEMTVVRGEGGTLYSADDGRFLLFHADRTVNPVSDEAFPQEFVADLHVHAPDRYAWVTGGGDLVAVVGGKVTRLRPFGRRKCRGVRIAPDGLSLWTWSTLHLAQVDLE